MLRGMLPRDEVVERIRRVLERRPEVLDGYLFGSVARGESQAHSDVDVAVYLGHEPDTPYGYDADLTSDLMAELGMNEVDVVILNRAPPLLYHQVLRDGLRLVSRDPAATTTREGQALSRYFDWVPQQAKIDAVLADRIRRGAFGR
jgi:predicted nucleotidyltransferase